MYFMCLSFHHPLELQQPHTYGTAERWFSSTKLLGLPLRGTRSAPPQRDRGTQLPQESLCPSMDPKLLPSHTLLDPPAPPLYWSGAPHANRGRQRRACGSSLPGHITQPHAGSIQLVSSPARAQSPSTRSQGSCVVLLQGMDSH